MDVRTQRLSHFGNRRQIGIDRKRHQRDQHRHQHGHGFFAQRGLLCSHSDFRFRKKYSKNKENNRLVRRLRIGWNYSRFQPCPITAKKPLQNLRPSETLLGWIPTPQTLKCLFFKTTNCFTSRILRNNHDYISNCACRRENARNPRQNGQPPRLDRRCDRYG